ncbi:mandelate racemase [Inquilinus sp. Marseille-Q2685]|uniref:mandelate racemase n=1 Tax=Inquilinus sp. Marseille-Q2685 TaxID=2866581 RepID=UPI001CE46D91|nr:mandelate racemase [Inquilinus sp. Marseille-Q2685]
MTAPRLRVVEARLYERPVRFRLPFRFGAATVTGAPQAFLRLTVEAADGRRAEGQAAELMVPKWFDKNPALTEAQNFDQLRRSLAIARPFYLEAPPAPVFALSAAIEPRQHAACAAEGLGGLIASFGLALFDRAVIDALCRIDGIDAVTAVRANRIGLTAATAPDLGDFDLDRFLAGLSPADHIHARHTVGLADPITTAEIADRLDDGLPQSLEQAIAAYRHTHFKLKLSGKADSDLDRLRRIAAVLERLPDYRVTLDGNETFAEAGPVAEFWDRLKADPALARLRSAVLFLEQPIARARALAEPIHALAERIPVEIDESDAEIGVFPRARALGYRGVSSKSCKGFYRSLLNRARIAKWSAEDGGRYFLSAEDLTTQGGVALQQDLVLAALGGTGHVERNGHHYVDGMAGAPAAEQRAFLAAHPDLYADAGGRARLAIRDGRLAIGSVLAARGLGTALTPDWSAMADGFLET